jgi:C4-type Zn-finger protein
MPDPKQCPFCKEECTQRPGKLPQCGETYLPATITECEKCEYRRWDPTGEPYKVELQRDLRTKKLLS